MWLIVAMLFFVQAEDGIRDLVRSRGLGDVYKRQHFHFGTDAYIYADVMAKSGLPSVISFYGHDVSFFLSLIHI